jgi:hypothetical protein
MTSGSDFAMALHLYMGFYPFQLDAESAGDKMFNTLGSNSFCITANQKILDKWYTNFPTTVNVTTCIDTMSNQK